MIQSSDYIVFSGANITSGGPLEIYRSLLKSASEYFDGKKILAIINDKNLFEHYTNVEFLEIKDYKRRLFLKFYYEYFYYLKISKKIKAEIWFSVNDCSPTVIANHRIVYCHNPSLFYKKKIKDFFFPSRAFLQSFYYYAFYRINIYENNFLIVQQNWLREYFQLKFEIPKSKIIVHRPEEEINATTVFDDVKSANKPFTFIYPAKAEYYKNIDVILDACKIIESENIDNFTVLITVKGDENNYAKRLLKKADKLTSVKFLGSIQKNLLDEYYTVSDCLIFSSLLETWGLPISEAKALKKKMIVSDLPYARETVGEYDKCKFFNPNNPFELSKIMCALIQRDYLLFDVNKHSDLQPPYATDYKSLFKLISQTE